jgi:hypothetical protein
MPTQVATILKCGQAKQRSNALAAARCCILLQIHRPSKTGKGGRRLSIGFRAKVGVFELTNLVCSINITR